MSVDCAHPDAYTQGFPTTNQAPPKPFRWWCPACNQEVSGPAKLAAGLYVRFDGAPGHEGPRFIELENERGESQNPPGWHRDAADWLLGPFALRDGAA